jgi:hypothetical protein
MNEIYSFLIIFIIIVILTFIAYYINNKIGYINKYIIKITDNYIENFLNIE